jgi:hypothetical protein
MEKKPSDPASFRMGYLQALDDCEEILKELGFDDAKEIMNSLRPKHKNPRNVNKRSKIA